MYGEKLPFKLFLFATRDTGADSGWANVIVPARGIMHAKALLKQHLTQKNRTELYARFELMQTLAIEEDVVVFSTVEDGTEPSLLQPFVEDQVRSLPKQNPCNEINLPL